MNNALSPRLIQNEQSVSASNCIVRNGNLASLKSNASQATPTLAANAKTIYLYQDTLWFSWANDVDVASSPIAEDPFQRVYFTGNGTPKYTNSSIANGVGILPFASYQLGLQTPTSFGVTPNYYDQSLNLDPGDSASNYPIETASGYINTATDDDETRFYVCTYVSAYGEESAPGILSSEVNLFYEKDSVTLTFSDTGGFSNQNITTRRIYRTATSGDITQFFLVAEIPVTDTSYVDNSQVFNLGAELTTQDYNMPPAGMKGLIITSSGVAIGFVGKTIVPSEPFLPYTYPLNYRQTIQDDIVAMASMSGGIVVATNDKPVIIQGTQPDSFTISTIDAALPCVSKRSMVDMGEAALYASHDGLVSVSGSGASIITKDLLSREYWRSLNPSTIEGYRYHEYYIGFYGGTAGFMFDLRTGNFFELDFYADAGYFDSEAGKLYLLVNDALVTFDEGTELNYTWQSKTYEATSDKLSCAKVYGEELTGVTFKVIADNAEVMSLSLSGADQFIRLPAFRAKRINFELIGDKEIESVVLASSPQELNIG